MNTGTNHWTQMLREWSEYEYVRILVIVVAAWGLIALAKRLVPWGAAKVRPNYRFYALPWISLLRLSIILSAVALIVPLAITPTRANVLALVGAAGLAIGFVLKDYLGCLVAGIVMLIERPYRVGDWIQIGDTYGEVVGLGLRTVAIRTADDNCVTIPYVVLWDSPVSNATSSQHELLCVTDFFVHPDHDNAEARQILFDVAVTSPYLKLDRPIVVVMRHEPVGAHYKVKAYPMDAREQFVFMADLTERGQFALHELGLRLLAAPVAVRATR